MKVFYVLLLSSFFATYAYSQTNFRNTHWGMSEAEVKGAETAELLNRSQEGLLYKTKVADFDAVAFYSFFGDKLAIAGYFFDEKHLYNNDHIDDYQTIKSYVTEKYGHPISDNVSWKDDLYKNDVTEWGFAISIGHLMYTSRWKSDDIEISLTLKGDNFEISHMLMYANKDLTRSKLKEERKIDLDNFFLPWQHLPIQFKLTILDRYQTKET